MRCGLEPTDLPHCVFIGSRDSLATSNAINFAIYETGFPRGQQNIDGCQLDWLSRTAEIAILAEMLDLFIGLTTAWLQHGPDRPRSHDVGPNAPLYQLLGERLGVSDNAGFGGGIVEQDRRGS